MELFCKQYTILLLLFTVTFEATQRFVVNFKLQTEVMFSSTSPAVFVNEGR